MTSSDWFSEKLGVNRVLRYGLTGFLSVLIAALVDYAFVKARLEALGPIVGPLAVLAFGGAVFIAHNFVLIPIIFAPSWVVCHRLLDSWHKRTKKEEVTNIYNYLAILGVHQRKSAYSMIKHVLLKDHKDNLELKHSEIHTLIVLTELLIATSAFLMFSPTMGRWYVPLLIAAIIWPCAVVADIYQMQDEMRLLRKHKEACIVRFLKDENYLPADPASP